MSKLRIAIQKSGRLSADSLNVLSECGIRVKNGGKLKAEAANFPLEALFLRDDDIPQYVADNVADIGILGQNVVIEKAKNVVVQKTLGFSKCRLSLAVKREDEYTNTSWFEGKKIATSYPVILSKYLQEKGVNASIEEISGSVEIAPGIGLADGVCDIVSTGSTLLTNGLKEVETVMKSEAVLVSSPNLSTEKQALLDQLLFRLEAVQNAQQNKYILLNAPNAKLNEISALLPGMKSPTILPLAQEGWSSLHSVVKEDEFWEVIDQLKGLGAQGILVCPIEKMIL
ncbi:MAG: ATP phosphoribosyltransferase [Crocinitomicaceae bacterium]|nr:ATP phosphoribosyltransferase [Crocinitomicaceae bacterium]|tara:strand:+ start:1059 stop:1913 length:855 start_codon:yes stop_codon:yes gene_type:complete